MDEGAELGAGGREADGALCLACGEGVEGCFVGLEGGEGGGCGEGEV